MHAWTKLKEMRQVFDIRGRYGTFGKIDTIDVKKTKVVTGLPASSLVLFPPDSLCIFKYDALAQFEGNGGA